MITVLLLLVLNVIHFASLLIAGKSKFAYVRGPLQLWYKHDLKVRKVLTYNSGVTI